MILLRPVPKRKAAKTALPAGHTPLGAAYPVEPPGFHLGCSKSLSGIMTEAAIVTDLFHSVAFHTAAHGDVASAVQLLPLRDCVAVGRCASSTGAAGATTRV